MKKYNILLIDDIISNIELIVEYLEETQENYELMTSTNAKSALKILEKRKVDLIITDWEMPEVSGIELIQNIKKQDKLKDLPCIVVTGMRTRAEDLQLALEAGAVDFLRKPVNKVELWARVKSTLELSDSYQTIKIQKEAIETQKKQQLSSKTLQIYEKNQMLENLNKQLKLYFENKKLRDKETKEILTLIRNNIAKDKHWEIFKKQFEEINPNFLKNLIAKFPQLTPTEIKMCTYIYLGLGMKEIADFMNIDYNGARVQKSRIKKKLDLGASIKLDEYIQNLAL